GDRDLFRQKPPGAAARQLRAAGRPDIRLYQPHHADLGPGAQLPDAAVQAAQLQLGQAEYRIPDAAQRSSRCSAEPGPTGKHGDSWTRISSAPRRKRGALRSIWGTS